MFNSENQNYEIKKDENIDDNVNDPKHFMSFGNKDISVFFIVLLYKYN